MVSNTVAHKNSTISQLEDQKKKLRAAAFGPNGSEEKRKEFYQCLQAIGELKKREKKKQEAKTTLYHEKQFLAVQDSSITDIVCPLVGRSEPTNNQSLGSIKEWP